MMFHHYIVIRDGVYRHEIVGAYTGRLMALVRAQEMASDPTDDGYHSYVVLYFLGGPCEDGEVIGEYQNIKGRDRSCYVHFAAECEARHIVGLPNIFHNPSFDAREL